MANSQSEVNQLYPVFLRLDRLSMLIVGAGCVGAEKLHFILKSSSNAHITLIAREVRPQVQEILEREPADVQIITKDFQPDDVIGYDLAIAATDDVVLNREVHRACKRHGVLVNVADTPALCDFYLGSIVTKGALKIAMSTNGKSPTLAKRMRQLFEEALPDEIDALLGHLEEYRAMLRGDFAEKVRVLNEHTRELVSQRS